jgi:tRNA-specific 2-thiouridylase
VLDYESRFRRDVIDDFAGSYLAGETPVPCIRCNERVKFGDLLATARDLGAEALATGHYVRRVMGPAGPELHRAADPTRDQSYFLFSTTPEQLGFLRFPLGGTAKSEVRAVAARLGLAVAGKPDSQDICFVPDGAHARLIERLRPGALSPGDIVDTEGRVLGRHQGIINFTVGQRRGLGLGGGDPLYVLRLEAEQGRVVVGPRAALLGQRVALGGVNWLGPIDDDQLAERPLSFKLRSAQLAVPGRLTLDGRGGGTVVLDAPVAGIAPGQACVFYEGERVLGGGWIRREAAQAA